MSGLLSKSPPSPWAALTLALWLAVPGCGLTQPRPADQGPRPAFSAVVDDPAAAMSTAVVTPTVSIDGREYASLVAAVLAASDGDILKLEPGLHGGPVEFRSSLTLEPSASLGAVTIHSRSPTCVSVRGDVKVVMRGLTLRADGSHGDSREAAVTVAGGELSLEYCHVGARANGAVQVLEGTLRMEQCSVLVEQWQTAILVGEDSESWLSDCRVENRAVPGTGVEVWESSSHIIGGRFAASGAAVVAGEGGQVMVDEALLINGGVVALQNGSLALDDCDLVGSVRAAVRSFGLVTLAHSRLQQHDLGLIVSGPDARLTVIDCHWIDVDEVVAFEDTATEEQLFMDELVPPTSTGQLPSGT